MPAAIMLRSCNFACFSRLGRPQTSPGWVPSNHGRLLTSRPLARCQSPKNSIRYSASGQSPQPDEGSITPGAADWAQLVPQPGTAAAADRQQGLGITACLALGLGLGLAAFCPGRAAAAAAAAPATATPAAAPVKPSAHVSVLDHINYKMLQVLCLPAYGKFAALVMVGAPLLLGGAFLYSRTAGTTWGESVLKTYYVLNSVPGTDITKEERKSAQMVMNGVHVLSIFTFATIVGVLADDISTRVEAARAGNWKVLESGHTVILGWDERRTPLLVQQLLEAHHERGAEHVHLPVVVLVDPATASKEDVDAVLAEGLGARFGSVVMTRAGSPLSRADLERVSAGAARTVILLPSPDGGAEVLGGDAEDDSALEVVADEAGAAEAHAHKVDRPSAMLATLAALHSVSDGATPQSVIVSMDGTAASWDSLPAGAAVSAMLARQGSQVASVAGMREMNDMLAHTALHPGLSAVFEQVGMQGKTNMEFYIRRQKGLTGQTFRYARRCFPHATVCGVMSAATRACRLNPPDSYVLTADDQLVIIAPDQQAVNKRIQATPSDDAAGLPRSDAKPRHAEAPPHVVVLAPGGATSSIPLLASLADAAQQEGTQVTLVARRPASQQEQQAVERALRAAKWHGCKVHWVKEDSSSVRGLLSAGLRGARAVVVAPPGEAWSQRDADAQVVASTLHVVEALMRGAGEAAEARTMPLRLVCGVSSTDTRQVLASIAATTNGVSGSATNGVSSGTSNSTSNGVSSGASTGPLLLVEPLLEDQLMSGLMGQVAVEPCLEGVFTSLLARQDEAELYTRPPAMYGLNATHGAQQQPLTWGQVSEVVRAQDATALGVVNELTGGIQLCISSTTPVSFAPGDRLVVLADE